MAGGPKTCFALRIPITSAASDTSSMNGHMTRVSKIVSAVFSGAKETGKHHLPDQTEHKTAQNGDGDYSRRARTHSPILHRSHRRTKNSVPGFPKAKKKSATLRQAERRPAGQSCSIR